MQIVKNNLKNAGTSFTFPLQTDKIKLIYGIVAGYLLTHNPCGAVYCLEGYYKNIL